MEKYTLNCEEDGVMLEAEGMSEDDALSNMSQMLRQHLREKHPDEANKSEEELRNEIRSNWAKM